MTKITIDRSVVEQALEALEQCGLDDTRRSYEFESAARIALRAALAEPVQEPVAWLYEAGADRTLHWYKPPLYGTPLYTTPPQRKPLTDEEIRDLWSWSMTAEAERTATTQQHAFARAIERAHGIGETK